MGGCYLVGYETAKNGEKRRINMLLCLWLKLIGDKMTNFIFQLKM